MSAIAIAGVSRLLDRVLRRRAACGVRFGFRRSPQQMRVQLPYELERLVLRYTAQRRVWATAHGRKLGSGSVARDRPARRERAGCRESAQLDGAELHEDRVEEHGRGGRDGWDGRWRAGLGASPRT